MNLQKIRVKVIGLTFAVALLGHVATAYADSFPLITVNERGVGTIVFPGGAPSALPGVLAPDPGPGGQALALTYDLSGPPSLVAGDVTIIDSDSQATSEVIRFNPARTGAPGYPASLVFYSDSLLTELGDLADIGLPSMLYTNTASLFEVGPEGENGVTYTPTANQPGYVQGFAVTYVIHSDSAAPVPEPATMVLVGTGLAGLLRARSRKKLPLSK